MNFATSTKMFIISDMHCLTFFMLDHCGIFISLSNLCVAVVLLFDSGKEREKKDFQKLSVACFALLGRVKKSFDK